MNHLTIISNLIQLFITIAAVTTDWMKVSRPCERSFYANVLCYEQLKLPTISDDLQRVLDFAAAIEMTISVTRV
jgi:hypothetical protein